MDKKQKDAPAGHCHVAQCKASEKRYGFCGEHFEHYKFGLVKQNGQRALDYDKKLDHFKNFLQKQNSRKVA